MATEQNGAGNQGAAGRCGEAACAAGAGLWQGRAEGAGAASASAHPADGVGDARAPLLGLAPGPAPSAHAPGPRRGCDGQRCPRCRAVPRHVCRAVLARPPGDVPSSLPSPAAVTAISAPPGPLALVPPPRSPVSGLSSRLLNLGFSVTPSGKNVSKNTQRRHSASRGRGLLPPPLRPPPAPTPSTPPGHHPPKTAPAWPWP